jgi:hypothetical protein
MSNNRIQFSAENTYEDTVTFAVVPGAHQLAISVSEEKALDSYNHLIDCTFHMTKDQIGQLQEFLNFNFPKTRT